jgi:hypothetical protein
MEPTRGLPFVVSLDDCDDLADVIDALALGRFAAGIEPVGRTRRLNRVRPEASLLPAKMHAAWTVVGGGRRAHLAQGQGWTLRAVRWSDRTAEVTVTAVNDALATEILDAAVADAEEPAGPDDETVVVGFWHHQRCGKPSRVERDVAIQQWSAVRRNYSAPAASALESVMNLEPRQLAGRLLLLHGPPGTGKTTALRSLAHAWRSWCRLEVVLDPERLLGEAEYLTSFIARDNDDDDGADYRLIVLEDCDELIRADAKRGAGQSLGRLLNLTDGFAGQGLAILVAITTNEPIHQLHPAIVRPGRCLAEISIGSLSRLEAIQWLGRPDGIGPDGATLAELFVLRGQLHKVQSRVLAISAGQYL